MNIKKYCISKRATVIDAIRVIEENKERCVFIVNDLKKIIGILSQGDILKYLADDVDLHTCVEKVCKKNFIYLNSFM
jgi:CBS domain-containing protein